MTNDKSKVLCHQVFRNAKRISVQCTKPFYQILKAADGFGGVDFQEEGAGWYTLSPRSELLTGEIASDLDRALFLAQAALDLGAVIEALEALDTRVVTTVMPAIDLSAKYKLSPDTNRRAFRVVLAVSSPLSSAMRLEKMADTRSTMRLVAKWAKPVRQEVSNAAEEAPREGRVGRVGAVVSNDRSFR